MNTLSLTDKKDLKKIIEKFQDELIENKFNKKKDKIHNFNYISTNIKKDCSLFIKALSIKSIDNTIISLKIHRSFSLNLFNLLKKKDNYFTKNDYISLIKQILELILNQNNLNPNLYDQVIIGNINDILVQLISLYYNNNDDYINDIFQIILENINLVKIENIPLIGLYAINSSSAIFKVMIDKNNNYEKFFEIYCIPIIDTILQNFSYFINEKNSIYSNDFMIFLRYLYDWFYLLLSQVFMKNGKEKRKEIGLKLFNVYGKYIYQLLKFCPLYDESTSKLYGKEDSIIVFNADEKKCYDINFMKYKVIQFLIYIMQSVSIEKKNQNEENIYVIEEEELIELINKIIELIISDIKNNIKNKNKYKFLRKYKGYIQKDNDCFNILIYIEYCFFIRCLIREPFISNYPWNLKKFILENVFPMMIMIEDEIKFLGDAPEEYNKYLNDIITEFHFHNFRTSACFLISKLLKYNYEIKNFVLSFSIEMMNYIINEGKVQNYFSEYNIYLKYIKDSFINELDDITKLDLSLLVILVLKETINDSYFKNYLREILLNNQDKFHLIQNPIIKIKLCRIYSYFLNIFFEKNETNPDNLIYICRDKQPNYTLENDISENIINIFNVKAIDFLFNNIIQNENDFKEILIYEASEAINNILTSNKNEMILKYIFEILEKNFSDFIKLIELVKAPPFYILIEKIITGIEIKEKDELYKCINSLTKKFILDNLKMSDQSTIYFKEYFSIINSFFNSKNKINNKDKEEIKKFNKIFESVINYVKLVNDLKLYEELISTMDLYMENINGINSLCIEILNIYEIIIEKKEFLNLANYNFLVRFISNIKNNIYDEDLDETILLNKIIKIIDKIFVYKNESNILYSLILILQILNLNFNLNEENIAFLLNKSLNKACNDYDINNIIVANICLGIIFYPDITFKILNSKSNNCYSPTLNINLFINIFISIPNNNEFFNLSINQILILGICRILTNAKYYYLFKKDKCNLNNLFIILIQLIEKQKTKKNNILYNLSKKDVKCDFVGEEMEEDEEDDDDNFNEFHDMIDFALSNKNDILNTDEFKLFSMVVKHIKKYESEIYDIFINNNLVSKNKYIEELCKIRNVKIIYKEKEYIICRKICNLKKNINNSS